MTMSFGRVSIPSGSYHFLDSLVPPSIEEDKSIQGTLLRLENITACAIVKNEKNWQLLSKTPRPLHKVLWHAYLTEKFFGIDKSKCGAYYNFDELPELLYHWPYEEFHLKQVMPRFLPRLEYYSSLWVPQFFGSQIGKCPYYINKINLLDFYTKVTNAIVKTFTNTEELEDQNHKDYCVIRKINISGSYFTLSLDSITERLEIDEPFLKNRFNKLEVELDVSVPAGENRHGLLRGIEYDIHELAHWYSNSSKSVTLKFNHVSLYGYYETEELQHLVGRLINNGTKSLRFGAHYEETIAIDLQILEEVFKDSEFKSRIVTLELVGHASTLNSLQYLRHLINLDLSNCYLHGGLNGIKEMHNGLVYLKLQNCSLRNEDLEQLIESPHNSTLKELNLSRNTLAHDDSRENLIKLFKNLKNILVLDLDTCNLGNLETWTGKEKSELFYTFKDMTDIVTLNLHGNQLSHNSVSDLTKVLKENDSLRYLKLSLPSHFFAGANNASEMITSYCTEINTKMNDKRSQLLYIEFTI